MNIIYLDHNSTTPLLSEVAQAMAPWQGGQFGNPSSQHQLGRRARQAVEDAREEIARILGARLGGPQPDRVIFTSGGTEANNLAIFSLAGGHAGAPGAAIVSAIEHPSVAEPARALGRRGWAVHRLPAGRDGTVDRDALDRLLSPQVRFASVMLANNETGVVQPVGEIARRAERYGVRLHTDAAQAIGKLRVDFRALGAAAMTVAAHKFHGPLGIGALVARHDVDIEPLMYGGFQQEGLRGGTESAALVVGMQAALTAWEREADERAARMSQLRDRLEAGVARVYDGPLVINGAQATRTPNVSSLALVGIDRQALVMALDLAGVACSTGSACASGSSERSAVLVAMGCPNEVLDSAIRLSVGATTTEEEIDEAIARIGQACQRLRKAPATRGRPARA
jgi:cysteine desulfurase